MTPQKLETVKLPLSVFIIACNEADRIGAAIRSVVDWVDEVIVIDSGSVDETVRVSEEAGARVLTNPWPGYGLQKRFGEDQCRQSWLLNIDADEVVSDVLREEIHDLFNFPPKNKEIFGYWINCVTVLPAFVKGTRKSSYPKLTFIRLYHRDYGRYSNHRVHDVVEMPARYVASHPLTGVIDHYTIRDLSDITAKFNRYSDEQIQTIKLPATFFKKMVLRARLFIEFPLSLFKFYVLRGFWRHGLYGFILAMTYSFARFLRMGKVYEKELQASALPPALKKEY